jgi:ATP-dependent exoDNAse (exonuclease V) beta subunit
LLHEPGVALSADGGARVQRILPVLEHAIAERGRRPLRDQVESVWLRLGGPAALDETALEDAAAYFDLLEGLDRGADLDDFGWFREQVNALFAHPDTRAGDALQLMTIHKAKGLEFDTVILPGLEERTRSEDPTLVLWVEQSGELLLAPIKEVGVEHEPLYDFVRRLARSKDEHETARLLYVAATRARSSLHLTGCVTLKADGGVSEPVRGSFLKLLWPRVAQEFGNVSRTAESEATEPPRIIRRVPAGWQTPAPPPAIAAPRQDLETLEPARVSYQWAGQGVRLAGTALHGFLQRIAREGLEAWDERAVKSRRDLYRNALANLGVAPLELEAGAARVEAGLVGALRDPRGRWILDAHAEAECEYSIAGLIDGRLVEAVIDRTFVDEQGVRWIIDYKTSEHEGGDMETFLENERARYQEQLERYARLLFGADQRPIRLGLYFPLLGGWREWAAPVVQRKQATQATLFEL